MKLFQSIFLIAGLLIPLAAQAKEDKVDATKAAYARMKERFKDVDQLKLSKLAGENNQGLLAARGELTDKQKNFIESENKDRTIIYETFAKKFDVPVKQVALSRAAKIHKIAKAGTWIQNRDGTWVKKK